MGFINWSDRLSVGVIRFDEQHKKLIEIINTLQDAMSVGKGKDAMYKIFKELLNYTIYHFSSEEDMLKSYSFPNLPHHAKEHNDLKIKVKEYDEKLKTGQFISSIDLMNFLKAWLMKHILESDKEYGKFLNSKGVK